MSPIIPASLVDTDTMYYGAKDAMEWTMWFSFHNICALFRHILLNPAVECLVELVSVCQWTCLSGSRDAGLRATVCGRMILRSPLNAYKPTVSLFTEVCFVKMLLLATPIMLCYLGSRRMHQGMHSLIFRNSTNNPILGERESWRE